MRKLMTLLIALFVAVMLLPSIAKAADADEREVITEVNLTVDAFEVNCGEPVVCTTFNVPDGVAYRFSDGLWRWVKPGGTERYQVNPGNGMVYIPGTWIYEFQIRVDGEYGTQYRLPQTKDELTIKVNGIEWELTDTPTVRDTYSFVWVSTQGYNVTDEGVALGWCMPGFSKFSVPTSYLNSEIEEIALSDYTYGGKKPYSYSKISGPSWLTVDSTGDVTGTPVATGNNEKLVVRITDAAETDYDIELDVNPTYRKPEDRIVVTSIQGSCDDLTPSLGQNWFNPSFDVPDDAPYYFNTNMGAWFKRDGDDATWMNSGDVFEEGTYFYGVQIRIDGENGRNYRFLEASEDGTTSVLVNGRNWTIGENSTTVMDHYSCFNAYSPDYVISDEDASLIVTGVNLTLQDNLSFNLYSSKSLYDKEGYGEPYVVFNVNGTERTVHPNPKKSTDTDYAFTCNNIAPHMIGDDIGFTIYVMKGDQKITGMSSTYSVTTYCNKVLEAYTTKSKLTTMIVDLLNYGAAAQNYMDYKTDALVNEGLTSTQQSWATEDRAFVDVTEKLNEEEADLDDATFLGAALNLGETVSIRYVFTAESLSGLTLKVTDEKGNSWTFTESDFVPATESELPENSYSLYCRKLHAGRMSDKVYATLYRGTKKSCTVAYSIESYASKVGTGTSKLQLLLKAMMKYGDAARKCAEQ